MSYYNSSAYKRELNSRGFNPNKQADRNYDRFRTSNNSYGNFANNSRI